jgi:hypothetical protein
MEWLAKLSDLPKLPTRHIALIAIITGALIFSPGWFLEKLHLATIPPVYGSVVGIVFLASSGLFLINLISALYSTYLRKQASRKRIKQIKAAVSDFDPHEQAIIREFIIRGAAVLKLPMDNPSVVGLEANGIVERVGTYGQYTIHGMMFPYRISKTAQELISTDTLGLPGNLIVRLDGDEFEITPEGFEWVANNRPDFTYGRRSY